VLVAEDNPVNQKLAQKMLESLGATLEVAADGFQVLQAVERTTFDVVLMDCQMPGMDGFVATACVRERERGRGGHLPIVAVTANALGGDREHCLAKGMDDYISKPITRQQVLAQLECGRERQEVARLGTRTSSGLRTSTFACRRFAAEAITRTGSRREPPVAAACSGT
jgi:CheY-like chemotaxis protein